ncbi:GLPGLI family protein [Ferruginibacter sp. SUN106]|uniref:GLPGLI family protein n=1 Tax=Ferruginibacter sp. SUN106 TaxID=2978348 RepID=UPI003D36CEED
MKYLLLLCFLFCENVKAQNTYSINYRQTISEVDGNKFKTKARLVYNDSLSFFYFIPPRDKKDKLAKLTVLGDKLIHHGVMYDKKRNEMLEEVTFPENSYFVLVDSPRQHNWIFTQQSKSILGHTCKQAYTVEKNKDTTTVWYTEGIGTDFGPIYYWGLPGIVLEASDQRFHLRIVAEKIALTSLTVMLPQNVERVPAEKYGYQKLQQ